jgi:hypothetical protein
MKVFVVIVLTILLFMLPACKKDGVIINQKAVMQTSVNSFWIDPQFIGALSINGKILIDSIGSLKPALGNVIIEKMPGSQRLQLKNLKDGSFLLDTLLNVEGPFLNLRILQLLADNKPVVEVNPIATSLTFDKRSFGFVFSDPLLPDAITMEVYRVTTIRGGIITAGGDVPVSVFENLQKGKLNIFEISYDGLQNAIFLYKIKNTLTGTYLPNGNGFNGNGSNSNNSAKLAINTGDTNFKNFMTSIFDVKTYVVTGILKYASDRLVSY